MLRNLKIIVKKIYIRCDGGNVGEYGSGHVSRMLSLAKSIKKKYKKKINIVFLIRKQKNFKLGYNLVKKSNFKIFNCKDRTLLPNSENEKKLFGEIHSDLIIIDRLYLSKKLSKFLKNLSKKFIVFDTAKNKFIAEDQIFNINNFDKKKKKLNYFKYYIMNSKLKFNKAKNKNNLFICFGGIDKKKFSIEIVKNLDCFSTFKKIYLITRDEKIFKSLKKIVKKQRKKNIIKIFNKPDNFYNILDKCKYSITSGGLTFVDSVISGSNTLAVPQYSHQIRNINFFNSVHLMPYRVKKIDKLSRSKIFEISKNLINENNFLKQRYFAKKYFKINQNLNLTRYIYKILNAK